LKAKAIVVATGSATIQVPGFEFDGKVVIGAREAVSLHKIPKKLLVVGGGVIGLELGMVYQSFGAELTVVELTPSLLPGTDPEAVKVIERTLKKRGAKIFTETRADGYEVTASGAVKVKLKTKTQEEFVECDQVL